MHTFAKIKENNAIIRFRHSPRTCSPHNNQILHQPGRNRQIDHLPGLAIILSENLFIFKRFPKFTIDMPLKRCYNKDIGYLKRGDL